MRIRNTIKCQKEVCTTLQGATKPSVQYKSSYYENVVESEYDLFCNTESVHDLISITN